LGLQVLRRVLLQSLKSFRQWEEMLRRILTITKIELNT
jgi:hypothetical protein